MGHFQPLNMKHILVRDNHAGGHHRQTFHVSPSVLGNEHMIRYDIENVVDRTLTLQRPNMMLEKRVDIEVQCNLGTPDKPSEKSTINNKSVKIDILPSGLIKPKLEVKLEPLDESSIPYKMIEMTEKRRIPWFAGCEYQCRYENCEEMFFYNQDLRTHIKKVHGDPDDYLDKFKVFETKDDYITCKECFVNLKRHFSSVFLHLRDRHGSMTIQDYAKKHKMKDYDKTYKVLKKVLQISKTEDKEQRDGNSPVPNKKRRGSVSPSPSTESKKSKRASSRTSTPVEPLIPTITGAESPLSNSSVHPTEAKGEGGVKDDIQSDNDNANSIVIQKPWFSGCEYECQLCQKIFFELNELLFHVKHQHNMTAKPYQKKFTRFETKKAFYQCKLCFSKIKHTKTFIANHLAANHNSMKLNAYEEVFHPANGLASPSENDANGKPPADQATNDIVMSSEKFKAWARGTCQFQCKVCQFTTGGSVDFWKHVKNSHNLEIQVYKDAHGNPCIVMNKIICKGCQRVLRYDYGTLLGHASTKHNMTLIEFYNKFYKMFIEGSASSSEATETSVVPPIKVKQEPADVNGGNNDDDGNDETNVKLVPMLARGGSALKKRAHMWGWRCHYKCAMCKRVFSSRVGIQKHVNLAHNVSLKEYTDKYGPPMTKKVHHTCLICQQKVLHDPSAIAMHIRSSHKMTYEDYYLEYVEGSVTNGDPPAPKAKGISIARNSTNVKKAVVKPMVNLSRMKKQRVDKKIHHSGREEHFRWAHNAAEYKCKLCNHTTKVMNTFQFHIKTSHGLPIDKYRLKYGPLAEHERKHKCKICSTSITWRANNIISHLNCVHANMELTLKDYYYVYIKGGHHGSPPTPPTEANGSSIRDHFNVAQAINLEDYPPLDDVQIAEDEPVLEDEEETHICLICSESIELSTEAIELHLQQTHSIDFDTYEKRFRDQLDKAEENNMPVMNDEIEIENVHGEEDNDEAGDDDDFGSVFEDEDEENELDIEEELAQDPLASQQDLIQSPEDIDDIDIEENVNYITDAL